MNENNVNQEAFDLKKQLPFFVALAGAAVSILANFIKYLTASNFFFKWKVSISELIIDSISKPDKNLASTEDVVTFAFILIGIVFQILALLCVVLKKTTKAIVFSVIGVLPFLMIGQAWIHYVGAAITVIGAIWLKIATGKSSAKKNMTE